MNTPPLPTTLNTDVSNLNRFPDYSFPGGTFASLPSSNEISPKSGVGNDFSGYPNLDLSVQSVGRMQLGISAQCEHLIKIPCET